MNTEWPLWMWCCPVGAGLALIGFSFWVQWRLGVEWRHFWEEDRPRVHEWGDEDPLARRKK